MNDMFRRVLDDDKTRLICSLDKHNARVLRFLLLTGLRKGEAQKACDKVIVG